MGDPIAAIVDFETCLKLNPDYTKAMHPLAKLYVKTEKFKPALKYFGILIEKEPSSTLYFDRGVVLSEIDGKEEDAISDFTNAIKLDPKSLSAYENRGILLKQMQEFEKAIDDFTKLVSVDDPEPDFFVERGMCYYELDDEEKAAADFKKALEIDPENERAEGLLQQLTEEVDEEEE
jgi:tetratricopeptide (TPR) repeat protein